MNKPPFVYPFISQNTCEFSYFSYLNNVAKNTCVQVLCGHISFLLHIYLGVEFWVTG